MSERPLHSNVLVELHTDDFRKIHQYYTSIGFSEVWQRQPDGSKGYLVLRMGYCILCFWCGNGAVYNQRHFAQFPRNTPRGYGVELVVMVDRIEEYYDQVKSIANVVEPLQMQPWGLPDFRAVDPAGYYLRFTSTHNILDRKYAIE